MQFQPFRELCRHINTWAPTKKHNIFLPRRLSISKTTTIISGGVCFASFRVGNRFICSLCLHEVGDDF